MPARRVLLLLLLVLPGVHAIQVSPESVTTHDGVLLVRWDEDAPGGLELEAAGISGVLSDTVASDRVVVDQPKVGDAVGAVTGSYDSHEHPIPSGPGRISVLQSETATVLVQPLSSDFKATLSGAPVSLRNVDEEVLERSHAYGPATDDEPEAPGDYYVYRVQDVVAAKSRSPTDVHVRGDFMLYLWNVTVVQEAPKVSDVHRTGTWSTPGTTPLQRTYHFQHALVAVRDGDLRIHAPAGGALYATELLLHEAEVEPNGLDAVRLFSTAAGPRAFRATPQDGRLVLSTVPVPADGPMERASTAWLLAPLLLVGAAAVPNLLGLHDAGRDLGPEPVRGPLGRLRRGRAAGYLRLALHAEGRHRFSRAAFWMGRAARWGDDAEMRMQQAIFLRMAGRPRPALRIHRDAQERFRMDGAPNALNAYEAARCAALLDRTDEALHWVLCAVREEPWLAQRAPFEPDLAPLRCLPAFMDLVLAADPDGYLRP